MKRKRKFIVQNNIISHKRIKRVVIDAKVYSKLYKNFEILHITDRNKNLDFELSQNVKLLILDCKCIELKHLKSILQSKIKHIILNVHQIKKSSSMSPTLNIKNYSKSHNHQIKRKNDLVNDYCELNCSNDLNWNYDSDHIETLEFFTTIKYNNSIFPLSFFRFKNLLNLKTHMAHFTSLMCKNNEYFEKLIKLEINCFYDSCSIDVIKLVNNLKSLKNVKITSKRWSEFDDIISNSSLENMTIANSYIDKIYLMGSKQKENFNVFFENCKMKPYSISIKYNVKTMNLIENGIKSSQKKNMTFSFNRCLFRAKNSYHSNLLYMFNDYYFNPANKIIINMKYDYPHKKPTYILNQYKKYKERLFIENYSLAYSHHKEIYKIFEEFDNLFSFKHITLFQFNFNNKKTFID